MRQTVLVWVGAAVLVAVAGTVMWRLAHGPAAPASDLDAVMARLDTMQARADAREAAMQREIDRLQQQSGGAPVRRPAAPPEPELSPEARDAQMRAQSEAQRHDLEVLFSGQGAAPAHDPAPRALDAAFANPGVLDAGGQPVSHDVQCRAQMCLVTARFKPYEDGSDWATRVLMELASTLPNARVVTVQLPGGATELRIYAARINERDPFAKVR